MDLNSGRRIDPNSGAAYASTFPLYEQQAPQYPFPNPYNLAVNGYRRNELIYACTNKRAKAIAEPPIQVLAADGTEIENHPLRLLIKNPITLEDGSVKLTEKSFWRATETYLCVAGFAAWEIEFNRAGVPLNLWPMRPDWCSFRRGENNPLEYIRYQPYGLPPMDIAANRILLFQYFDPIYPLLKALSPSVVSSRVMSVDNAATDFLQMFFQRGAVVNGLLKTDQTLGEAEATRIRTLWTQQHGGIGNWGDPAVLGSGVTYQPTQMNFRDMALDGIDERDEARICMALEVPPILVNARAGLNAATYSNYEQARKAWYEEWVAPEWDWLDSEIESQLLPKFEPARGASFTVEFDLTSVKAMQESEDALHTRAREDARLNLITRDEAREILGLDPIDDAPVFVGTTAPQTLGDEPDAENEMSAPVPPQFADANEAARELERKQYRAYLKRGAKHGKPFIFKHLSKSEQRQLEARAGDNGKRPFGQTTRIEYGSDAHKAHIAKLETRAVPHERAVASAARKLFEAQRAEVEHNLQASQKSAPDPFDLIEWIKKFKAEITPLLVAALDDAGQDAARELGIDLAFEVEDPNVAKFLKQRQQKFAVKLNEDTWQELKTSFELGVAEGENIAQLLARVELIMGGRIRSTPETIARTEIISAMNKGTLESWRQTGVVKRKTWLATLDDRVRDPHAQAHGQTVAFDEAFVVDGERLQHPGDPNGSAGNVINCRCSMTAEVN